LHFELFHGAAANVHASAYRQCDKELVCCDVMTYTLLQLLE